MTKFAIATHGNFAKGLQSTLELFIPNQEIAFLSAYVEDEPPIDEQLEDFFNELPEDELAIIFTDLFGGSVNQKVLLASEGKQVQIIAGFNLPVVLEVVLNKDQLTPENLAHYLETSKDAMQLVTPQVEETISEDDFFA
ncbi:PTS sugar transporter subunit IIA [Enterococcus sp. AZ109]|uniref:PTS sugar transporter subunit IIA n=1 Tax=Enterococcus sp. AZ109 TaxID=2774634 RepID=UPI003F1F5472